MPYNPAGIFSLVASYFAQPGTTIRTEQHNPVFEDVGSALSSVLLRDGRAPMTGPLNMNGNPINNITSGNSTGSVATLGQTLPIGAVIDFAGNTAPAGYLMCFGQAVSRTTYAALFDVIGISFGVGDGSTTFVVPDLRGRVVAGLDNMGGASAARLSGVLTSTIISGAGGAQSIALTAAQLAKHRHSGTTNGMSRNNPHSHSSNTALQAPTAVAGSVANAPGAYNGVYRDVVATINSADIDHEHGFTTDEGSGVNGDAHNNVQPTMVMNKIIKASYDG